jgi:hypothetical protein
MPNDYHSYDLSLLWHLSRAPEIKWILLQIALQIPRPNQAQ